ncbi:molybdopterin-dependent oxidoreductase [Phenylobacterium sp. LjRoot219]|uniref:molybdopterin-containing oxidoreductase family protein n=1 Tax=Phenylobacterium sp. LjRoot219 TaxID=3342283 RepID=UPI003ED036E8
MEQRPFVCRNCGSSCPIVVTIDDDRVLAVGGDFDAPLYRGYTCPKARSIPQEHHRPDRLLHSLKRLPDGRRVPISSAQLVDEITERLSRILDAHGPQAVAAFLGNGVAAQPAASGMMLSFLAAIGSPMMFSPGTIDQPGLLTAGALHGGWQGGRMHPSQWEALLVVGGNPVVSKQYLPQNPAWQLKQLQQAGMRMIVIDPRRTETARRAAIHLQAIPGEDPTVLAGLIHLLFEIGGVDDPFVSENAEGAAALRKAVAGFTPAYVARRAGLAEPDLVAAARILAEAKGGDTAPGVGTSMSTRGGLTSYLALCIQTLRGFWSRAGDPVSRPKVLTPRRDWRAQPTPPHPAWDFGLRTSIRGLQQTVAGMPTAALPDLMMTDGPDRVRALFLHGGAYYAWPDTKKTVKALGELDLLVMHDVELSGTAVHADYVIATYDQLETPAMSALNESVGDLHPGYDWNEPYAFYRPPLLPPPPGADLMESWQIYYRVARKLGLPLSYIVYGGAGAEPVPFDMENEPLTDDIYEMMCRGSAVPLAEVKRHPHGAIFEEARETVRPRDPACAARLQLADPAMLAELAQVRAEDPGARRGTGWDFPFQLVCRRMMQTTNSSPRPDGIVRSGYNPLWMNPADMDRLDLRSGDQIEVRSRHGAIVGFVESDPDMRAGVVAMTHGFGPRPDRDYDPRRDGSNINLLLSWEDCPDPYHGMPRMSAVPVIVVRAKPEDLPLKHEF